MKRVFKFVTAMGGQFVYGLAYAFASMGDGVIVIAGIVVTLLIVLIKYG